MKLNNIHFRFILLFAAALILDLTVVKYISIFSWSPDLLLIVVVFYSLKKGPNIGMSSGFAVGLIQDLLSTHFLGLTALSKTLAGFVAGSLSGKLPQRTEFLLTLLISGLVHDVCYFFIYTVGEEFSLQSLLIVFTLPNVVYTVLIGGFSHYLLENWFTED